jgi:citrate lyase beta subunit
MKPMRSFQFVPGNKPSRIEKVVASKVDALILEVCCNKAVRYDVRNNMKAAHLTSLTPQHEVRRFA